MSDDQDRKAAIRARFEKRLGKAKAGARPRPALLSGGPGKAGVDADDLYDAASLAALGFDAERDLGFPGEPPFTRGVQPNMYRGRLWTMRQYAGFGTAEESNQKFRYLLSQGQTGLSVAFDLPSQLGYDSDDPMAIAEVGQVGVAIGQGRTLDDILAGGMTAEGVRCARAAQALGRRRRSRPSCSRRTTPASRSVAAPPRSTRRRSTS